MFKIKHKKKRQSEQDPAFPLQCTRAFLFSLRYAHSWQQLLLDAYRAMPTGWQPSYRAYVDLQIKPTFDELVQMIDTASQQGFITEDEAASLRAGKPIELKFAESPAELLVSGDHQGAA